MGRDNSSIEEEAKQLQKELAAKVRIEDKFPTPRFIGGFDVSNNLKDPAQMIYAAVVVLDINTLEIVDLAEVAEMQTFPYIPGLLGFREAPTLMHAFEKLRIRPDVSFVDGHGVSHPRKLGIASHIGVLLGIPTIGVAKSILCGKPASPLGVEKGSQAALEWKGEKIGTLYRSKLRSNPLIISSGHLVSLETATILVERCLRGYRLPEPTRQAHLAANACRKSYSSKQEAEFIPL